MSYYYLQNAQRILEIIVFDVSGKMLKSVENLHNAHQFPKISIMRTTVNTFLRFSIFMVFSLVSTTRTFCLNIIHMTSRKKFSVSYLLIRFLRIYNILSINIIYNQRYLKIFVLTSPKNDEYRKTYTYFRGIIT